MSTDKATPFLPILKACGHNRDLRKGIKVHVDILKSGLLETSPYIASSLITMYARCGELARAQQVLDELPFQNLVCWNALITGYVQQGQVMAALICFEKMQYEGVSTDVVTFVCILNACGSSGAILKGKQIHSVIVILEMSDENVMLGNALLDMYVKCGMLAKAQQVFDKIPVRDTISWNALIAGYAQMGQGKETVNCFDQMQQEGLSPDGVTYVALLKACSSIREPEKCKLIQNDICSKCSFRNNTHLGNTLVDMYAKNGAFTKAQDVLDWLAIHDVVSWNALIAGYAQHGQDKEALNCYEQMKCEGIFPDAFTFSCILKSCGRIGAIIEGKRVHEKVASLGILGKDIVLATALLDMYVKCDALAEAQGVLDGLPVQNVVSWNALISGYVQNGHDKEALLCFEKMQQEYITPDMVTFACILNVCSSLGAVDMGKRIHVEIVNWDLLRKHIILGNALVDMYAKCGAFAKAYKVLDELPHQDGVSWNALIAGYAQYGWGEEALNCFESMKCQGFFPDAVTFLCILKACGNVRAADKGKQIHDEIVSQGLLRDSTVLGNALIDMYVKCGALPIAEQVLNELPVRDVISWNTLVAGYAHKGEGNEALECFEQMQSHGQSPDAVTFLCILRACGSIGAAEKGKEIHEEITSQGLLYGNIALGNAVIDMYVQCGMLIVAHQLLDELLERDLGSWNAIIVGYAQQGLGEEVLGCLEYIQCEGYSPNALTFVCTLNACCSIGVSDKGKQLHHEIISQGLLGKNSILDASLVDMYASCGILAESQHLLEDLDIRYTGCWNSLIAGYAQKEQGKEALRCFERMHHEGVTPDAVTFTCVLNACSHTGLVDEGQLHFVSMSEKFGISPGIEHYTCMVDLYSRVGQFNEALSLIKKMHDEPAGWSILMAACQKWGNVKLGRWAFEHTIQVDMNDAAAYICMVRIYRAAGMHTDAIKIEAMRLKNATWSAPAFSLCDDVKGNIQFLHMKAQNGEVDELGNSVHDVSQEKYLPLCLDTQEIYHHSLTDLCVQNAAVSCEPCCT